MRLIAICGIVLCLKMHAQAEDDSRTLDVEARALSIELDSYLKAFDYASTELRRLELEVATADNPL